MSDLMTKLLAKLRGATAATGTSSDDAPPGATIQLPATTSGDEAPTSDQPEEEERPLAHEAHSPPSQLTAAWSARSVSSAESELARVAVSPQPQQSSQPLSQRPPAAPSADPPTTEEDTQPRDDSHDRGDQLDASMEEEEEEDDEVAAESDDLFDEDDFDRGSPAEGMDLDLNDSLERKYSDDASDDEAAEAALERDDLSPSSSPMLEEAEAAEAEAEMHTQADAFVSTSNLHLASALSPSVMGQPSLPPMERGFGQQQQQQPHLFTPLRRASAADSMGGNLNESAVNDGRQSRASGASSPASLSAGLMQRHQREMQQRLRMEHEGLASDGNGGPRSNVWMAVYRPSATSKIGVAYYSLAEETLFGGEFGSLEGVQALKYRLQPDVIVTSSTAAEELHAALTLNELDPAHPFMVKPMKRADFSLESAIGRLRLLHVEDLASAAQEQMRTMSAQEHTLLLRSVIDFQQQSMVGAMGGLILHLLHSAVFSQLETDQHRLLEPVYVRSIATIPTADVLAVDRVTMESLSIFVQEAHPGAQTRTKEGFSVFSVLNMTVTGNGGRMLHRWIGEPTTDREKINHRLDHVEYFTLMEQADLVGELRSDLRQVKDMPRLLTRFRTKPPGVQDWRTLVAGLRHMLAIGHLLAGRREDLPLFGHLYGLLSRAHLQQLLELIERVIELDEPEKQGDDVPQAAAATVNVRFGIDQKLDDLRASYSDLDALLSAVSEEDIVALRGIFPREVLERYSLVFLPQIGFLCRLPTAVESSPALRTADLEFKFRTDTDVFFKNATANALDEQFGDMQGCITDMEQVIVRRVQEQIAEHADDIREISTRLAELDCYLALATSAVTNNLARPHLTTEPVLVVKRGRHLLQEKKLDLFVANSTALGTAKKEAASEEDEYSELSSRTSGGGLIHILTGPNSSGKSVYLKQVGIIAYLAHTGSFVPADEATVGVCDSILTRIKGIDSVNSTFSTFTYDASQMAFMLRHCTQRSLCLIDEFGKGTANLDGIALLAGVMRHLEGLGSDCPKTLVATHFHELYSLNLVQESAFITFWKMDFIESEAASSYLTTTDERRDSNSYSDSSNRQQGRQQRQKLEGDGRSKSITDSQQQQHGHLPTITCLFKLVPGVSKKSFGTACAVTAGVPEGLMVRATQVANQIAAGRAIEPIDLIPGSLPSDGAGGGSTPTPFTVEEDSRWNSFLAFALESSGLAREHAQLCGLDLDSGLDVDSRTIQSQLADAIGGGLVPVEQLLRRLSAEQLVHLARRFAADQRHQRQTQTNSMPQSDPESLD